MAIRIVVVGMGPRGQDWLREVQTAPGYELVACVDIDLMARKRASSNLALASGQCFTELREALDQHSCDAVIVATSAAMHVGPCELALARGLAVMVEKPFTLSLRDAVKLVALAEEKRAPLIVAQNYRYMRSFRTARRLINAGALGSVGMVVCQYYRVPQAMAASLASLNNSALWGAGIHHLDALRYILKKRVIGVLAEAFTLPWGRLPTGGSLQTMLTFEDETRALYSATYESSGHEFFERGQEFYLRFVGERGTLHVFQRWLMLCETGKLPRPVRRGPREVTEERILLDQLERALIDGEEPDSSGRDNLQTMAMAEACLRSAAEHAWINPQELLDECR
ncbi:MAG TPA: Gfo/Idh/MocA family oxidoreductase [Pyrinomonadaceae bacterium]|jgi:predicted dehydrogenase